MGLAVGDDRSGIVSPFDVVGCDGTTAAAARLVAAAAARLEAARIVIGVPARSDGSLGPAARLSTELAEAVKCLGLEVHLQPEYLSTNEARRRARESGRRHGTPVDDIAAQIILEEYFAGLAAETRSGD